MFSKILIANRGEIACRVIRTARRLGIRTVAVFSDADASARHARLADEAVHLGGPAPRESYLNIACIVNAARKTGAQHTIFLRHSELRMVELARELGIVREQHETGRVGVEQPDGMPGLLAAQRERDEVEHGASAAAAARRGDEALGLVEEQVGSHGRQ